MNIPESQFSKGFFTTLNSAKSDHTLVAFNKPVELLCLRFYPESASIKLANTVIQSETILTGDARGSAMIYALEGIKWQIIEQVPVNSMKAGTTVILKVPVKTSRILIRASNLNVSLLICYREIAESQLVDSNFLADESTFTDIQKKILSKKFPYLDRMSVPLSNYVSFPPQISDDMSIAENPVGYDKISKLVKDIEDRKLKEGLNDKVSKLIKLFDEHAAELLRSYCNTKKVSLKVSCN